MIVVDVVVAVDGGCSTYSMPSDISMPCRLSMVSDNVLVNVDGVGIGMALMA
jgi:hypothetical protein